MGCGISRSTYLTSEFIICTDIRRHKGAACFCLADKHRSKDVFTIDMPQPILDIMNKGYEIDRKMHSL